VKGSRYLEPQLQSPISGRVAVRRDRRLAENLFTPHLLRWSAGVLPGTMGQSRTWAALCAKGTNHTLGWMSATETVARLTLIQLG